MSEDRCDNCRFYKMCYIRIKARLLEYEINNDLEDLELELGEFNSIAPQIDLSIDCTAWDDGVTDNAFDTRPPFV